MSINLLEISKALTLESNDPDQMQWILVDLEADDSTISAIYATCDESDSPISTLEELVQLLREEANNVDDLGSQREDEEHVGSFTEAQTYFARAARIRTACDKLEMLQV